MCVCMCVCMDVNTVTVNIPATTQICQEKAIISVTEILKFNYSIYEQVQLSAFTVEDRDHFRYPKLMNFTNMNRPLGHSGY